MIYRLEPFIEKIASPLICVFGDHEVEYTDGVALAQETFDKYWLVDSISVRGDKIVLVIRENDFVNSECGEESFF